MTVATELATGHPRLELFVCIEGVGWPTDETDLSQGFDGDVWVTSDFDGDLATQLGCTVHPGLRQVGAISDKLNLEKAQYSAGSIQLEIIDTDDWWLTYYRPHITGLAEELSVAIDYKQRDLRIDDGTTLAEGDVLWIGGQECVKLGTANGNVGTVYRFDNCLRGYLGTPRGRAHGLGATSHGFEWGSGTAIYDWRRLWHGLAVDLYAHVPGEAATNCVRLWSGKLASIKQPPDGNTVALGCTGDLLRDLSRQWNSVPMQCRSPALLMDATNANGEAAVWPLTSVEPTKERLVQAWHQPQDEYRDQAYGRYAIPEGYRYRTEPGGTAGMRSTWDAGNIQALTTSQGDTYTIMRYAQIGEQIYLIKRAWFKHLESGSDLKRGNFRAEAFSSLGTGGPMTYGPSGEPEAQLFTANTPFRWLLDNIGDSWELNPYAYDKTVWRHPVNVLLSHLLSRDDEYWIGDATGGTTSVITFAAGSVGTVNLWQGAALHCVEGNLKGQARVIASNTANAITLETAFTGAGLAGNEFQVRNSIYDTLPVGWGLQVPWHRVDIEEFERIRDECMSEAAVGKFLLGVNDEINLWEMLQKHILQPYGIAISLDRSTGKLTPVYMGLAQGDGIVVDYTSIPESELYAVGEIDHNVTAPTSRVAIKARARPERPLMPEGFVSKLRFKARMLGRKTGTGDEPSQSKASLPTEVGSDLGEISVVQGDYLDFRGAEAEKLELDAGFNTVTGDDIDWLIMRAKMLCSFLAIPPPTTTVEIDLKHALAVKAGDFLLLNKANGVINPFSASRGWSDVVAIVLGIKLHFGGRPTFECEVALLADLNGGMVAPSARLDGALTGSDGTSDYFVVATEIYTSDDTVLDYYGFEVGDVIDLYDLNGAVYAGANPGPYTISGFGANNSQTPEGASTDIIRIAETAPAAGGISGNYWLTFADWSASNTARMEKRAAYADASGDLTGGDEARTYG